MKIYDDWEAVLIGTIFIAALIYFNGIGITFDMLQK